MVLLLETEKCTECKSEINVNRISPIETFEEFQQVQGIYLTMMDEWQEVVNIGFLCNSCANKLCREGKVSLGVSGYDVDALALDKYLKNE